MGLGVRLEPLSPQTFVSNTYLRTFFIYSNVASLLTGETRQHNRDNLAIDYFSH